MRTFMRFLLLMLTAFPQRMAAQSLQAVAFNTADSVVVRWAPSSAMAWERFNRWGCRVERVEVSAATLTTDRLSPDTLRAFPLERLRSRFGAAHPFAPIVAQALYGDAFAADANNLRTQINAAQQTELRWSLCALYADIDPELAQALGYRWVDRQLKADGYYLYRVIGNDPEHGDTALIAVDRRLGVDHVPPGPAITADEQDGRIQVHWSREAVHGLFSAYTVERATSGGIWQQLNRTPFVPMDHADAKAIQFTYTDTTIAGDYLPYRYRVRGHSPFGMISDNAPEILAMGRDRTAPPNPVMKGVNDVRGRMEVTWEQIVGTPDLLGFRVEKAPTVDGEYSPLHIALLPSTARQFMDTSTFLIGENHYRVWALDTAGNGSVSLRGYGSLVDSVAPLAPVGLEGSIDTNGVVTVRWTEGREKDLLGYRVFFANQTDHEFNNLTPAPLPTLFFSDTIPLRTLTKRIYYKVVAVDRNFNHSGFSTILALSKPDQVEPVSPLFKHYAATDTSVVLQFVPSSSDDVASHQVLRKDPGAKNFHVVEHFMTVPPSRTWVDERPIAPATYSYTILAIDSAGNRSVEAQAVEVTVRGKRTNLAPTDLSAVLVSDRSVHLKWRDEAIGITHYVVYRSLNGAAPIAVASPEADVPEFIDQRLPGVGSYVYFVRAAFADGSTSAESKGITVNVAK